MLDLGHPNTSIQVRPTPTLSSGDKYTASTFPFFIKGRTYYFNQVDLTNYNSTEIDKYNLKFEPIYKGTTYRYKVKQMGDEYYLAELDFAGNPVGGSYDWIRRKVLSKIKQGDTIIFHQDEYFSGDDNSDTKAITITSSNTTPTGSSVWSSLHTPNTVESGIYASRLSIIGTVGQEGARTVFNVPYDFDVKFLRYQPYNDTSASNKDKGSFIITGNFYNYTVRVYNTTVTTPYFTLTPEGSSTQLGNGSSSPSLTNIRYGDLIFFNQTGNDSSYQLTIKTDNVDSGSNLDTSNFNTFIGDLSSSSTYSGLFFAPKNNFSLTSSTVYYNVGSDVPDKTVTGGSITSSSYTRPDKYTFEDTLVKHGTPGNSYCPYTKLTIPTFDNVKPNYLTLKYNNTTTPPVYEFYGVLNDNYYSNSTTNLLSELKLFIDTKYIITLDSSVNTNDLPRFSSKDSSSGYSSYEFEYKGENTFNQSSGVITFRVGENISNLYLFNAFDSSNTTIGSNYNLKIQGERNHNKLEEIRLTSLGSDVNNDPGSAINVNELFEHYVEVTVVDDKFVFSSNFNSDLNYYDQSTSSDLTELKLFNGEKYKFQYILFTDSEKELKFSTSPSNFEENNVTFNGTYDNSEDNYITFTVSGLDNLTTLYVYDGKNTSDTIGSTYNINDRLRNENAEPINTFVKIASENYEFYPTPSTLSFFKGYLDYENANDYINYKLNQTGVNGHSPLLGYAFDGYPIYGPIGYDTSDNSYNSDATTRAEQSSFKVKLLKSSYTGGTDSEGNPTYVKGSGDLDICNGVTSKTPEFPPGIFHYICTIDLNANGSQKLSTSSTYGYLNSSNDIVTPSYPYIIGAYKGAPEKSNFNTIETTSSSTTSRL